MKIIKKEGNRYWVQGETDIYIIDLNFPFSCTCFDFKGRHEDKGTFCKHIKFVVNKLEREKGEKHGIKI